MRNIVILCLLLHLALYSSGQSSLKTLVADIGPIPQLDAKAQQAIIRRDQLAAKPNLSDSESKELATLFEQFDETKERSGISLEAVVVGTVEEGLIRYKLLQA